VCARASESKRAVSRHGQRARDKQKKRDTAPNRRRSPKRTHLYPGGGRCGMHIQTHTQTHTHTPAHAHTPAHTQKIITIITTITTIMIKTTIIMIIMIIIICTYNQTQPKLQTQPEKGRKDALLSRRRATRSEAIMLQLSRELPCVCVCVCWVWEGREKKRSNFNNSRSNALTRDHAGIQQGAGVEKTK
jgi:hypothetical protein